VVAGPACPVKARAVTQSATLVRGSASRPGARAISRADDDPGSTPPHESRPSRGGSSQARRQSPDPSGSRPTTTKPCQLKWSGHDSCRGLNSVASSPVSESMARWRAPLRSEQPTQALAKLLSSVSPPALSGMTWSTWNVASCPTCARPQYSQRPWARSTTNLRSSVGMAWSLSGR
jgi:hypothetical protein